MGGVAQLGERLPCTQEVIGSNPFTSTIYKGLSFFILWFFDNLDLDYSKFLIFMSDILWPSY